MSSPVQPRDRSENQDLDLERSRAPPFSGSDLSAFDPETAELKGAVIDPAQALVIAAALGLVVCGD
jgi:hypothetical protein